MTYFHRGHTISAGGEHPLSNSSSDPAGSTLLEGLVAATRALDAINVVPLDRVTLSKDRARLQGRVQCCKSLSAEQGGSLGLPSETLSEIFVHCLPEDLEIANVREAPLVLTRVCRYWREVALATPFLWSGLGIPSKSHGAKHMESMEKWLSRAGVLPLHLAWRESLTLWDRITVNTVGPELIKRYIEHCKVLDLGLVQGDFARYFIADELPLLEKLCLVHYKKRPCTCAGEQHTTRLPRLKDLVYFWSHPNQYDFLVLPWAQLASLHIGIRGPHCVPHVPQVIAQCRQLEALKLDILNDYQDKVELTWPSGIRPFPLPKLRLLTISSEASLPRSGSVLSRLVHNLILPELEVLALTEAWGSSDLWTKLLARSRCPLRELNVTTSSDFLPQPQDLMQLLKVAKSLQDVSICAASYTFSAGAMHLVDCLLNGTCSSDPSLSMSELQALRLQINCSTMEDYNLFAQTLQPMLASPTVCSGNRGRDRLRDGSVYLCCTAEEETTELHWPIQIGKKRHCQEHSEAINDLVSVE
ncbi:hypothetical protein GLOTRDRAFT_138359 [Gloeophyllum trabeum ATCC 11539]|uniref:Uncharacterized protein n=1 Tax=Gloeophyllum trabeum (strain ATCC 11539 / FP-39264 / Madison 617) TaxID=670483 RepID=S7Q9W4_GLOTA|nr:uncharacterized protein GLOTRDRAFT_138359 [Gloeophyllum trabeum ATCC 11539]EPQ56701.1 hypothetical protein GLOTRDRAFT_138359 [Gloeophyllum trabeum ATCC 11539]